jgi:hypothetical protein
MENSSIRRTLEFKKIGEGDLKLCVNEGSSVLVKKPRFISKLDSFRDCLLRVPWTDEIIFEHICHKCLELLVAFINDEDLERITILEHWTHLLAFCKRYSCHNFKLMILSSLEDGNIDANSTNVDPFCGALC